MKAVIGSFIGLVLCVSIGAEPAFNPKEMIV